MKANLENPFAFGVFVSGEQFVVEYAKAAYVADPFFAAYLNESTFSC